MNCHCQSCFSLQCTMQDDYMDHNDLKGQNAHKDHHYNRDYNAHDAKEHDNHNYHRADN